LLQLIAESLARQERAQAPAHHRVLRVECWANSFNRHIRAV
jgi:hypothetical protein